MTDELLFLPIDDDTLAKGPNMIRPPAGARAPMSAGPKPNQPKLGAAPKAGRGPTMPKPRMGGGGGAQKYDYVPGDQPMPAGAEGKTPGGYWKVPKGAGGMRSVSPDKAGAAENKKPSVDPLASKDVASVDAEQAQQAGKTKDPLTGQMVADTDKKVEQAAAEVQKPDQQQPQAVVGDKSVDPAANTMVPDASSKKKRTQAIDFTSKNPEDYKDAHPVLHYAVADKFRKEGDDKMAAFHENMAKQKSENFTPEEHAKTQAQLQNLGMDHYAQNHAPTHELQTGEYSLEDNADNTHNLQTGEYSLEEPGVEVSQKSPVESSKEALQSHKESGAKAEKELSTKHSERERSLKEGHKQREAEIKAKHDQAGKELAQKHSDREKDLKAKHFERENAAKSKHEQRAKDLQAKHEARRKDLEGKINDKTKDLTEQHRSAQDEHEKAKQHLENLRSRGEQPSKINAARKDVQASRELVTEAKRKLDDHKSASKVKLAGHKEASAKELAEHKSKAAKELGDLKERHGRELEEHKQRSKFEMDMHNKAGKQALEGHKQSAERELADHKAQAQKELDTHREAHGAKGKELQGQHEAAVKTEKENAVKQKAAEKQQAQVQKQQQKEQAKAVADAAANQRRPPSNPQEELLNAAHRDKAKQLHDNIQSHMQNPDLDETTKEKLGKAAALLQEHMNSGDVPTPEMQQQLKQIEQSAGTHGKKGFEGSEGEKPAKEGAAGGKGKHGLGGLAHAWNEGQHVGAAVGSAAAQENSGALGQHVLQYGANGAGRAGHFLLNSTVPQEGEAGKATQAVTKQKHEAPNFAEGNTSGGGGGSADETATVSANKSIRLFVRL